MTRFDPKNSSGSGSGSGGGDGGLREVPPNDYLLAMVGFAVRTGRKPPHRNYMNARFRVIHGECSGAEFYCSVGIDVGNQNIANRLGVYCRCIGHDEEFDPSDKADLMRVFLGKPFKAKVSRRENGKYVNNDLERYIPDVSDAERSVMDLFAANFRDTERSDSWGQTGGGTQDPQGDPFAGDGHSSGGDPFDAATPPGNPADDDIPF